MIYFNDGSFLAYYELFELTNEEDETNELMNEEDDNPFTLLFELFELFENEEDEDNNPFSLKDLNCLKDKLCTTI